MSNEANSLTSIEKPRCQRCGQFKTDDELNGIDPLATGRMKYVNAYCRRAIECDSSKANNTLRETTDRMWGLK